MTTSEPKRPTLRMVAERAGVSVATASRTLTGNSSIAAPTKAKVMAAVEELGYEGQARHRKAAPVVGLVTPSLRNLVTVGVVAGVEDASREAGSWTIATVTDGDPERERSSLAAMLDDDRIAGVVVIGGTHLDPGREKALASTLRSNDKPVVFCGRSLPDPLPLIEAGAMVVDYDNVGGAVAAVSMLIDRGHRRIGLVRGPETFSTSIQRSRGYELALEQAGIELDPELVRAGPRSSTGGWQGAKEILAAHPEVTAFFGDSDDLALGVYKAAADLGRTDLSVVGFDDSPVGGYLQPALTTVHMPWQELGRRATRLVQGQETWRPELGPIVVGTHLVLRDSVTTVVNPG
ncbi:LacI family DNA-binding transcriptional regulator [Parenemella sanctibonifatiensis]|uniref:LacI family DNA-binding transcriptional regulator n=1 Tax=Parenemella sanctibonifatiensis TaxID=2016505 RepID=UPI0011853052|nr:LacI family DNA-binding transcriptional regulator [Parenemella sanctibonifatiensis]